MKKENILNLFLLVMISVLVGVGVVSAATTISTDITTGGALTVTGGARVSAPSHFGPDESTLDPFLQGFFSTYTSLHTVKSALPGFGVGVASLADDGVGVYGVSLNVGGGGSESPNSEGGFFESYAGANNTSINALGTYADANGFNSPYMYGLLISSNRISGGSAGTNIGVLVKDQTVATDNYAIKTGLGKVSFGDSVGIGTTTPVGRLHITSGASATTTVTIGEIGLSSSKGCVNINTSAGTAMSFYFNAARTMIIEANYCR